MESGLTEQDLFKMQKELHGKEMIIIKFTADWCGPCKKAKPIIDENLRKLPESILFNEVDIDESIEVYGMLKSKRLVTSIPALICYNKDNDSLWPDEIISSSNKNDIDNFFNKCINQ